MHPLTRSQPCLRISRGGRLLSSQPALLPHTNGTRSSEMEKNGWDMLFTICRYTPGVSAVCSASLHEVSNNALVDSFNRQPSSSLGHVFWMFVIPLLCVFQLWCQCWTLKFSLQFLKYIITCGLEWWVDLTCSWNEIVVQVLVLGCRYLSSSWKR